MLPDIFSGPIMSWMPGFHISVEDLDNHIIEHGVGAELRQAMPCPCVRIESRQTRAVCPHCAGQRWIFPEHMRKSVIVLIISRSPMRKMREAAEMVTGTSQMTFTSDIRPGPGDMVLPDDDLHVVTQDLFRAVQQVNPGLVRHRSTTPDQLPPAGTVAPERLLYPDVVEVQELVWLGDDGQLCFGRQGDYQRVGNTITWTDGHGPAPGRAYTVRYTAPAAYMLFPGEPMIRGEGPRYYPIRCEAQRLDRWQEPGSKDLR